MDLRALHHCPGDLPVGDVGKEENLGAGLHAGANVDDQVSEALQAVANVDSRHCRSP